MKTESKELQITENGYSVTALRKKIMFQVLYFKAPEEDQTYCGGLSSFPIGVA